MAIQLINACNCMVIPRNGLDLKEKRNPPSAHATISIEDVYIQNNNENQRFSLTTEEFNKLLTLGNSDYSTQNTGITTVVINLSTTSQNFGNPLNQCNFASTKLNSKFY